MLSGERVTLRPVRDDDLPTLYEWRVELATWAMTTPEPAFPITWELYKERAKAHSDNGPENANFAVEVDGTLVGRAGLFKFDPLARSCEVGLHFGPEHRGKGYGRETLRLPSTSRSGTATCAASTCRRSRPTRPRCAATAPPASSRRGGCGSRRGSRGRTRTRC